MLNPVYDIKFQSTRSTHLSEVKVEIFVLCLERQNLNIHRLLDRLMSHNLCPISCCNLYEPIGQGKWDTLNIILLEV